MTRSLKLATCAALAAQLVSLPVHADSDAAKQLAKARARAAATVARMSEDEKTVLTHGVMAVPLLGPLPKGAVAGAGFVPGISRLEIPALTESDASLGVAYVMGMRKDGGATALPSGMLMGSTWNPDLLRRSGAMIGSEARAKGFNVLLAGGINLIRDPRNGRTFEYLSEDPLLSGELGGASIAGIQTNHIISTIKHYALNDQETGRYFIDARISEASARESDLLAFQIAIEKGQPGSVMCAYNKVNGDKACASEWLLNEVLKKDWRYPGFVMSDWGGVPGIEAAIHGLDQQSGAQLDKAVYLGDTLAKLAKVDPAYATRVDDMNQRILTSMYANGLDAHPVTPGGEIDKEANAAVAEEVARQGIVLLRNEHNSLPLARTTKRLLIVGGHADQGVLSGAGSSQVHGDRGPALAIPKGGDGPFAAFISEQYHSSSPLKAIRAASPSTQITYVDGAYVSEAVTKARMADVVIVFATQWSTEAIDHPDLSLPNGQDALISALAAANPNTIVVLETGGPVLMPWLDQTSAVIEAWYPGAHGGGAIAAVLFGEANPSGHLPVTFPASLDQLPRPSLDGLNVFTSNNDVMALEHSNVKADYDIEGSDIGYRWNARRKQKALFPFGFGLSYTSFETSALKLSGTTANFTIRNTGSRDGATVAQLYLVERNGEPKRRLLGYQRVSLTPGASQKVAIAIDRRLLADWKDGAWNVAEGRYSLALGVHAEALGAPVTMHWPAQQWTD